VLIVFVDPTTNAFLYAVTENDAAFAAANGD
jgi:hypothetical protein